MQPAKDDKQAPTEEPQLCHEGPQRVLGCDRRNGAMPMGQIIDVGLLFALGLIGWLIFRALRVPIPALIGTLVLVGGLRMTGVPLPQLPSGLESAIQILLGLYVGSMITKDTLEKMQQLLLPSSITMAWVLGLAFLGGWLLRLITHLDILTGVLASSTGGLPEMTVIALSTNADVNIVVFLQLLRTITVVLFFPVVLRRFAEDRRTIKETVDVLKEKVTSHHSDADLSPQPWPFIVLAAVFGGTLFLMLGVPAGGMVGAIVAVVIATMLGYHVTFQGQGFLNVLLVGVGLLAADSISPEVRTTVVSTALLGPVLLSLSLTFASSFLLALVLHKISSWDYPTCFMAAAPAGLTVMTALALQYNKDPMPIFVLHMARVLILKTGVPLILAFFI